MKKRLRAGWMLGTLCALAVSMQAQAAELSDLAPDAAIIQGTLDNGVRYALWPGEIKNDTYSIALVRKDSLCFIEEISKARKESSPDSVFFRAFRETQAAIAAAPEDCGTDNSLLFVVGDFNKEDILSRMRHLSVILPAHTSSWKRAERDAWQESAPALSVQPLGDGFALLEYSLLTKAIEEKYLSTIVPAVSERSWTMLSHILRRRMETTLRQRDIAFNGLQVLYRPAAGTETSNRFTIRLNVDATDGTAASQALCDVLEDLRTGGSSHQEIESAARHYLIGRQNRQMRAVSDKEKIRRLFSAYLYHTDLAPEEVKTQFFASRKYKAGEDKQRFDRFAARTLRLPAGHQAQKGASVPPKLDFSDTLAFPNPAGRIKLSRSVKEGTSGGSFLFFENGTTAVYKKMPCGGRVYFSFIFDGGNSRLRRPEASAYVEDMFYAGSVNGYPVKDFLSLLAAGETDIRLRCGFSALVLEGSCRQDKLSSLLKALVTLTGHFKVNENELDYPFRCERIPFRPGTCEKAQNEIAGILHDCAKNLGPDKLRNLCCQNNIPVSEREKTDDNVADALLHSKVGALLAKNLYNVDDKEILDAIYYHTVGRPEMPLLEKIIYLADFIEPSRTQNCKPGLDVIRKLAKTDIDRAVYYATKATVDYVTEKGRYLNPESLETLKYYSRYKGEF